MIETRKLVPDYYEHSRDYQVFLKLLDLIINACDADTKYFASLISPTLCKARLLPLLSNYVGYTYDYAETVKLNRLITKNWALLKRNRGSLTGFSMAIALALSQVEVDELSSILDLFNVDFSSTVNDYGRQYDTVQIYLHYRGYLSKMYDLLEAVRPAGVKIDITQSQPISSTETISLTDEFLMLGYDYVSGKLLKIGDSSILVENSWEILKDGVTTSEYLIDNEFYDERHNFLNKTLDSQQRILLNGEFTGEIIKAPYIYKVVDYKQNTPINLRYIDSEGVMKTLEYTGKYFNLEHGAHVCNTCYVIKTGGKNTDYFINSEDFTIMDSEMSHIAFQLKDFLLDGKIVKKVYSTETDEKVNWHINPETGFFVKDSDGVEASRFMTPVPWDEYCYISNKRYIMNISASGVLYTTKFFVNQYEDIQDDAGNIILSVKDRYKVSDSAGVGFSEVHSSDRNTDYNKTFHWARSRTYHADKDFYNNYNTVDYNDYNDDSSFTDTRITLYPKDFSIDLTYREYDGTTNIGQISAESLSVVEGSSATIPVDSFDGSDVGSSNSKFYINKVLVNGHNVLDVFKELSFTFDTEVISDDKNVFMRWKAKDTASQYYNFGFLPEVIVFPHKGRINKRKLKFTNAEIEVTSKVYDGSTDIQDDAVVLNNGNEEV